MISSHDAMLAIIVSRCGESAAAGARGRAPGSEGEWQMRAILNLMLILEKMILVPASWRVESETQVSSKSSCLLRVRAAVACAGLWAAAARRRVAAE
eukprot:4418601-Prymnesium_polylepis.1